MWKNPNARCDHRNVHIEFYCICEGDCWIQKTIIVARRKNENARTTPPTIATQGEWDVGEVSAFWPPVIGVFVVFEAPDLLGFPGVEESLELKDGVVGGEDDDEEGEVYELVELETSWVGEDEERGEKDKNTRVLWKECKKKLRVKEEEYGIRRIGMLVLHKN